MVFVLAEGQVRVLQSYDCTHIPQPCMQRLLHSTKEVHMPQVSVDFSDVEEFELLPEGDYIVEIDEVEAKQSSTGKAMLALQLVVREPEEYGGRKLFDNMMLEGNALWRTKRDLGVVLGDVPDGAFNFDTNDMVGTQVGVYVGHRKWKKEDGGDDSMRADVRKYTSLDNMEYDEGVDDLFA